MAIIDLGNVKGPQGPQGIPGPQGPQGLQGPKGEPGDISNINMATDAKLGVVKGGEDVRVDQDGSLVLITNFIETEQNWEEMDIQSGTKFNNILNILRNMLRLIKNGQQNNPSQQNNSDVISITDTSRIIYLQSEQFHDEVNNVFQEPGWYYVTVKPESLAQANSNPTDFRSESALLVHSRKILVNNKTFFIQYAYPVEAQDEKHGMVYMRRSTKLLYESVEKLTPWRCLRYYH